MATPINYVHKFEALSHGMASDRTLLFQAIGRSPTTFAQPQIVCENTILLLLVRLLDSSQARPIMSTSKNRSTNGNDERAGTKWWRRWRGPRVGCDISESNWKRLFTERIHSSCGKTFRKRKDVTPTSRPQLPRTPACADPSFHHPSITATANIQNASFANGRSCRTKHRSAQL